MSKQKIFRQVLCSERLPKEDGFYNTDFGICSFDGERFWQQSTMIGADWWLEEVELPSEDEIKQLSTAYSIKSNEGGENVPNHDLYKEYADIDFKAGFNKAIELIKGEGLNNG